MKFLLIAAALMVTASGAGAATFSRQGEAYCRDISDVAKRAAERREAGRPYVVGRARDGWRPERHLVDFDVAYDREMVSKAVYASRATPNDARLQVLKTCLDESVSMR